MNAAEYSIKSKELFRRVEDKLDEYEEDVDFDKSDGKVEIVFEKGGPKMVVNTQRAIMEIWLAGNTRAWHFKWHEEENRWFAEAEQVEFYTTLAGLLSDRLGQKISFE